jgi:hypothetical protein
MTQLPSSRGFTTVSCAQCGNPTATARRHHRYTEGGFANVTLVDIEVRECRACGSRQLNIPRLADLHQLLAGTVGSPSARLTRLRYSFRFDQQHRVWLWSVEGPERTRPFSHLPS